LVPKAWFPPNPFPRKANWEASSISKYILINSKQLIKIRYKEWIKGRGGYHPPEKVGITNVGKSNTRDDYLMQADNIRPYLLFFRLSYKYELF